MKKIKSLYTNEGDVVKAKSENKSFPKMDDSTYESLTTLEKRTSHLQDRFESLLPWLFFVTLIQGIGIILGFCYVLLNLISK